VRLCSRFLIGSRHARDCLGRIKST
jgi:hypothetical protein